MLEAAHSHPSSAVGVQVDVDAEAVSTRSPANLTLGVGHYQIVIDKFRDFNVSQTSIDVSPGHVHHFKANLSQGAFMAFLRVSANVRSICSASKLFLS